MTFKAKVDEPTRGCPTSLLEFDHTNPRLVTGDIYSTVSEEDIISVLNEIASLDELITSICTNNYLDLEPMIVIGEQIAGLFQSLMGTHVVEHFQYGAFRYPFEQPCGDQEHQRLAMVAANLNPVLGSGEQESAENGPAEAEEHLMSVPLNDRKAKPVALRWRL